MSPQGRNPVRPHYGKMSIYKIKGKKTQSTLSRLGKFWENELPTLIFIAGCSVGKPARAAMVADEGPYFVRGKESYWLGEHKIGRSKRRS